MKTSIKILGTGCPKCNQTIHVVKEVIQELDLSVELEKVDDIMEIIKYNVLSTPAVVINEKVEIKGRVPNKKELIDLLKAATTC